MNTETFTAHTKDVGGIPVARLLPQKERRTIGAWCFLDHAGPAVFKADSDGMQVGAHPHTNLQTFTWMLEGEMWHQDSLGFRQLVRPGQVNLMTAGTGSAQRWRTLSIASRPSSPSARCRSDRIRSIAPPASPARASASPMPAAVITS